MPVWDLQLVQSLPGGLDALELSTQALLDRATPADARAWRKLTWILPEPEAYLSLFLGEQGWIARARRLDYPDPSLANPCMPAEYVSLLSFMDHCATDYPASWSQRPLWEWPGRLARQATRRWRETSGVACA